MRYFTWKLELVSNILWMLVGTMVPIIFYQISLSPQVKWAVIISNKNGVFELPHELPNDLRSRILEFIKLHEIKISKLHEFIGSCPVFQPKWKFCQFYFFCLKNRYWTFPEVRYFTWNLKFVSSTLSMIEGDTIFQHVVSWVKFWASFYFPTLRCQG